MNEEFGQLLKNLDLSVTQIKIYLCVLKRGLSTVLDISRDTKITRSQIYYDTSILVERGILELASKRKKKFLAIRPVRLSGIINSKVQKLKSLELILPSANTFFKDNFLEKSDNFEIKIFEGMSQVKKAFNFELEDAKGIESLLVVGDIDFQHDFFSSEYWEKWNRQFTLNKSQGKMLIDVKNKLFSSFSENRNNYSIVTRGLADFPLSTSFNVWKDYVLITTFSKKPVSVLIRNSLLAKSYRDIFNKLWNVSERKF